MPAIVEPDLARMRAHLVSAGGDRSRKPSRFWAVQVLAAAIATGIIIAPLLTPIPGGLESTSRPEPTPVEQAEHPAS
jgi:hypothetical protein